MTTRGRYATAVVDNQHRKIAGYRDLTEREIALINMIKQTEREVLELWRQVRDDVPDVDRRWHVIARTHVQEGFSALVRSVARPADPSEEWSW